MIFRALRACFRWVDEPTISPVTGAQSLSKLVEVFFAILSRQAIRRGDFASVDDLMAVIRRFIDAWNERCQPFVWVKDADEILAKAIRKQTSGTDH